MSEVTSDLVQLLQVGAARKESQGGGEEGRACAEGSSRDGEVLATSVKELVIIRLL